MLAFFKTLCITAAFLSLALLFLPEKPAIRKASVSAFSLLLLLLLIPKDGSFDLSGLLSLSGVPEAEVGDAYTETVTEATRRGILSDLCTRFSLSTEAVIVESDLSPSGEGFSGSYLRLFLGKENFFADAGAVIRYVKNTYGVDCEVRFVGD
jgi:hypothetical protein